MRTRTMIWDMALGRLWRRRARWMNLPSAMTINAWMTMRNSVSSAVFAIEMRQLMTDLAMLPAQLDHQAGGTPVVDAGAKKAGRSEAEDWFGWPCAPAGKCAVVCWFHGSRGWTSWLFPT
jgi:hypothetical protein